MPSLSERRALQAAVAVLSLVPVGAGFAGVIFGFSVFDSDATLADDLDSHGRYLSGLLLGIGLGFWSTVKRIESQGARFRLLTAIVVIGGIGRLISLIVIGVPSAGMLGGLGMELIVTPALAVWRERLARRP